VVKGQSTPDGGLVTTVTSFAVMVRTTDTILLLRTTAGHIGEWAVGAADHEEANSPAVVRDG
jgi:hypothetical protein